MQSKYVIVGGGAGGLELACKLGRKLGPGKVLLVDRQLYHVWKPTLHEVAAGTLDVHAEGLSYPMLAHDNQFTYVYGAMEGLDTTARTIDISPLENELGQVILPRRRIAYESLVLAVGSTSNYFGIPGAASHSISLNGPDDAERFRLVLLTRLARAASGTPQQDCDIVIIGGGATGVELAAELREASAVYATYGYIAPQQHLRITIIEGAARILAPLPESVSAAAAALLAERGVRVLANTRVAQIDADRVLVQDGNSYPADIVVWAAGIKAPDFLSKLGLPTEKKRPIGRHRRIGRCRLPGNTRLGRLRTVHWRRRQTGAAPRASRAPASRLSVQRAAAARTRPTAADQAIPVPRSRLTGIGGPANLGWQPDGLLARQKMVRRRFFRTHDVCLAAPDAPPGHHGNHAYRRAGTGALSHQAVDLDGQAALSTLR